MPRRRSRKPICSVCSHPERHRIETLRLGGMSVDSIVARFPDLTRNPIYSHMAKHVSAETKAAIIADVPLSELATKAADEGMSLLDYLKVVRNTAMTSMLSAAAINDFSGMAVSAKRALETLREIGRLTGELLNAAPVRNYVQNNITFADPKSMDRMEAMLIERLAPYPGALQAVMAGLMALDAPPAPMIDLTPGRPSHAA